MAEGDAQASLAVLVDDEGEGEDKCPTSQQDERQEDGKHAGYGTAEPRSGDGTGVRTLGLWVESQ